MEDMKAWLNIARIGVVLFMIGGAGMDSETMAFPLVMIGVGIVMIGMGARYGLENN